MEYIHGAMSGHCAAQVQHKEPLCDIWVMFKYFELMLN